MDDLLIDLVNVNRPSIIQIFGVGGGGDNAVAHMYTEGNIAEVNYLVCNTDAKALETSPVPDRLQLGTDGLGAGGKPEKARELAEESIDRIRAAFDKRAKMLFITAGMGGGTGTGAAPVIAREAKAAGLLTIGVVTIPFLFEGYRKIDKALDGVAELSKYVDAILVINNERLREIYQEFSILDAFRKADDTLSVAVKSIVDIITMRGKMILDFRDVHTTLHEGGVAIMSTGYAEGEGRVSRAIANALNSPLINDRDIFKSRKILLSISFSSSNELMVYEMNEIDRFMENFEDKYIETKYGLSVDESLGAKIKITILASGFGLHDFKRRESVMKFTEDDINKIIRRQDVYGSSSRTRTQRPTRAFLFGPDELDDPEIIDAIDSTPTFRRTKELIEKLHRH
ncbi:MAG: cell division protein FtsZ [Bacteroidaceae bacterium]|nr:cell division protein FtsZ [Bacteroidaceae bacterium]